MGLLKPRLHSIFPSRGKHLDTCVAVSRKSGIILPISGAAGTAMWGSKNSKPKFGEDRHNYFDMTNRAGGLGGGGRAVWNAEKLVSTLQKYANSVVELTETSFASKRVFLVSVNERTVDFIIFLTNAPENRNLISEMLFSAALPTNNYSDFLTSRVDRSMAVSIVCCQDDELVLLATPKMSEKYSAATFLHQLDLFVGDIVIATNLAATSFQQSELALAAFGELRQRLNGERKSDDAGAHRGPVTISSIFSNALACSECGGSGRRLLQTCKNCGGAGILRPSAGDRGETR